MNWLADLWRFLTFRPRHTVDSVLRELVVGLENGTIVVAEPVREWPPLRPSTDVFMEGCRRTEAIFRRLADAEAESYEREWLR